ncbi:MAG TPA: hypothetical protein VF884_15680 [Nitrososphaeraceae archaeon]
MQSWPQLDKLVALVCIIVVMFLNVTQFSRVHVSMQFILTSQVIWCIPFVAFRINSAISSGCDTSDAWLELSDTVVAFIRPAKLRSAPG